jgi:hypothetical protein
MLIDEVKHKICSSDFTVLSEVAFVLHIDGSWDSIDCCNNLDCVLIVSVSLKNSVFNVYVISCGSNAIYDTLKKFNNIESAAKFVVQYMKDFED